MKTRAQDRAESVEPGAAPTASQPPPSSRKRRASSASQSSEIQVSQSQPEPLNKKRKKTSTTTTTVHLSQSSQDVQPNLPTVQEETRVNSDTDAARDAPAPGGVAKSVTTKTASRRATLPAPASGDHLRNGSPIKRAKGRKSMPVGGTSFVSLPGGAPNMVSLQDAVYERVIVIKDRESPEQIDGAQEMIDGHTEYTDMLVYSSFDGPAQPPSFAEWDAETIPDTSPGSEVDSVITTKAEQERHAFETSIERLTREAAEAKSQLEILTVELQSMGFGVSQNPTIVLESIHAAFNQVRVKLRGRFPDIASDRVLENAMLVQITDKLLHLTHQIAAKDRTIAKFSALERELSRQISALVDELAHAVVYRDQILKANEEWESQGAEDERYIKDMEKKLATIEEQHLQVTDILQQTLARSQALATDNDRLEESSKKLKSTLDEYRQSEQNLEAMITRMEEEHISKLQAMEEKHQAQSKDFTERLERESSALASTRNELAESSKTIVQLEKTRDEQIALIDGFRDEIQALEDAVAAATAGRVRAEGEVTDQTSRMEALDKQLGDAEDLLERIQDELDRMTRLHESEQRQREAAEAELDQSQDKVKDLSDKVHNHGVEANELRQKLFEVQQRNDATIKSLKSAMEKSEEQHSKAMDKEHELREQADMIADNRQAAIDELEGKFDELEKVTQRDLANKEALLQQMEERAVALDGQLEDANVALEKKTMEASSYAQVTSAKLTALDATIRDLEAELSSTTAALDNVQKKAALQQAQMSAALAARDDTITSLTADVAQSQRTVEALEADKTSLERRVESEAEAMLLYQAEKDEEVVSLRQLITQKQAEISRLAENAIAVDRAWKAVLIERDERIVELEDTVESKSLAITHSATRHSELKAKLAAFVAKYKAMMDAQQKQLKQLEEMHAKEVEDAEELNGDAAALLDEVARAERVDEVAVAESSPVVEVVQKRKVRRSKKTIRDSGIGGMAESEDAVAM